MSTPTITDLRARVDAVKNAPLFQKAALIDGTLDSLLQYLAAQDARIAELERTENGDE
jgi:hypothetical protein